MTKELVGIKYWHESLSDWLGTVARRARLVSPRMRMRTAVACLLGTGYYLWSALRM